MLINVKELISVYDVYLQVCGRNADGGNLQSGCGHYFSWSSVPILKVEEVFDVSNTQSSVVLGEDVALSLTDDHFDISEPLSPTRLYCAQCSSQISGTMFECLSCKHAPHNKPSSSSNIAPVFMGGNHTNHEQHTFCLSCVRKELNPSACENKTNNSPSAFPSFASTQQMSQQRKTGFHRDHTFRLAHPPKTSSEIMTVAVMSISSQGLLEIHDLLPDKYEVQQEQASQTMYYGTPIKPAEPILVTVEVHPDGRILFADNHCRAVDWLCLDSIMFNTTRHDEAGSCNVSLDDTVFTNSRGEKKILLRRVTEQDPPLVILGGDSWSAVSDQGIQLLDNKKPSEVKEMSFGQIQGIGLTADTNCLVHVRRDQSSKVPRLIMNPCVLKVGSNWTPLPKSPNESFSLTAEYFVHGDICHLSGYALKDFASCSLKHRAQQHHSATSADDLLMAGLVISRFVSCDFLKMDVFMSILF